MTVTREKSICLILPTIDEAGNIASLITGALALEEIGQVIVVDDGSRDGTRDIVHSITERDRRVQLIARDQSPSLTASLQEGIDTASTPLVGWMDADGTMAVEDIPHLWQAISDGADLAVGSRFITGGALKEQQRRGFWGRMKSIAAMRKTADGAVGATLSWVLNSALLPVLLGRFGAYDWTSGFIVARRDALRPLRLRGSHGEYFFDLWVRAERVGLRVVQVPTQMQARKAGRSKTGVSFIQLIWRGRRYIAAAARLRMEGWIRQ